MSSQPPPPGPQFQPQYQPQQQFQQYQHYQQTQPQPQKPAKPKNRKPLIIAISAILALVLAGIGFIVYSRVTASTPEDLVLSYMKELEEGKVPAFDKQEKQDYSLMTEEIYSKTPNRPTNAEVVKTDEVADGILVTVSYTQGDEIRNAGFTVELLSSSIFTGNKWKISRGIEGELSFPQNNVNKSAKDEPHPFKVNDVEVSLREHRNYKVLPGTYHVEDPSENEFIERTAEKDVDIFPRNTESLRWNTKIKESAAGPAVELAKTALAECMGPVQEGKCKFNLGGKLHGGLFDTVQNRTLASEPTYQATIKDRYIKVELSGGSVDLTIKTGFFMTEQVETKRVESAFDGSNITLEVDAEGVHLSK